MAYITNDIVFRKKYLRKFVETISVYPNNHCVEFEKRDPINSIIRSYLVPAKENYKPMFGPDVVKLIIPENHRQRQGLLILPKNAWSDLEKNFEDLFFRLYYNFEMMGSFSKGNRKELRIKFLHAFNITDDIMTEDSFRKKFDRFFNKKASESAQKINNSNFSGRIIYKSVC